MIEVKKIKEIIDSVCKHWLLGVLEDGILTCNNFLFHAVWMSGLKMHGVLYSRDKRRLKKAHCVTLPRIWSCA